MLRKSVYMKRVERLFALGLCSSEDASKYLAELRGMVKDKVDERKVKVQSRIFKALSDPTRLKMLTLLSVREMCVCEIMVALDATQPTISYHLNILEKADLIKHERRGRWIFYSLTNPAILKLLDEIQRSL
ncbi:MAG: ArsR/SmtB family transcription factor [Candidatus Bathyarchaeia archaeon]